MTGAPDDIHQARAFGKERYFLRYLPHAAGAGMLGLALLFVVDAGNMTLAGLILAVAGFGFASFALWRGLRPAPPALTLSPEGIRYRFSGRDVFEIPWNEVRGVGSEDIRIGFRHSTLRERDVPVIFVSEPFYRASIHLDSPWRQGPGWRFQFAPRPDGLVRIAFYHDVFDETPAGLRGAIERRWRAFSTSPETKLPPRPGPSVSGLPWLTGRRRLAVVALTAILAVPLAWHWQWGLAWLSAAGGVSAGASARYLDTLLDGAGAPARLEDGTMTLVRRAEIGAVEPTACHARIVRDRAAGGLTPAYGVEEHCLARLRLASGAPAMAAFRLVTEPYGEDLPEGDPRRGSRLVLAPLDPAEAERQICALGACR